MARWFIGWLFAGLCCIANADLVVWTPAGQSAHYILPGSLTPESYLGHLRKHPGLAPFVEKMEYSPSDKVRSIKPNAFTASERSLLLANNQEDHAKHHPRVDTFGIHFDETYVLPIGAHLSLNPQEKNQFLKELTQHFKLLIAMGGHDIHPALYGEKITHSYLEDLNETRDRLEAEVIRYFYHHSDNFIFTVCRGSQLTAAIFGAKLIQDNAKVLGTHLEHRDGTIHPVQLVNTPKNATASIVNGANTWIVNSYHHQSINRDSLKGTPMKIAALGPDGVVEGVELYQGEAIRGVLVQFHPEKPVPTQEMPAVYFKNIKRWAGISTAQSCRSLVSSLPKGRTIK